MLRIKDDVDLKELEKFGFRQTNYATHIYVYDLVQQWGISEVFINQDHSIDIGYGCEKILDVIYNLIQAGLVEKVKDNDE